MEAKIFLTYTVILLWLASAAMVTGRWHKLNQVIGTILFIVSTPLLLAAPFFCTYLLITKVLA